jgi:DNA-binding MarR family transcriptional regulator
LSHEAQVERAHDLIGRFVEMVMGRLTTVWSDQNLSVAQIGLLYVLAHAGTANVRQISERLHISQPAASLLVDRLVRAELAERSDDPADRRRVIVRLTERGEVLMGRNAAGRSVLTAWLIEQDDARLSVIIETFDTLLSITDDLPPAGNPYRDVPHPGT